MDTHIVTKRRKLDDEATALLTQTSIVVERVFRYLNAHELRLCSRVCSVWKETADVVKRRRREPLIFLQVETKQSNEAILIENFKKKLLTCYSERDTGVVFFANLDSDNVRQVEYFLQAAETSPQKMRYLSVNFSHFGNLIGLANTLDGSRLQPDTYLSSPGIAAAFFPDNIPGVQFFSFKIPEEFPETQQSREAVPFVTGIPPETKVKCLLVFKKSQFRVVRSDLASDPARAIIDFYVKQSPMALGGTEADLVHFINEDCRDNDDFQLPSADCGLAFAGDNFEAGSILIAPGARTKRLVTRCMMELRAKMTLRRYSLAFLFYSATSEIAYLYKSRGMESACFREVFPNVPFLGMKSHSTRNIREIIGTNFYPGAEKLDVPPAWDAFIHQKSATLILITWGFLPVGSRATGSERK